ncbi:hypothetical protein Thimo_2614 [Thioflavicoccus mobilis 8321]|uniref:Uncharacterized protein n=1 Tax=Thioflavicoccus mobilis 8321 TaxID=765912 RepID=L0GX42_9GAMM|nr:hypothetical protein [Thioflavicoccus mobilis]AGA91338.1 hypothetical protein Thimo_2614 [Thioflavicoccus mobilis 8321]
MAKLDESRRRWLALVKATAKAAQARRERCLSYVLFGHDDQQGKHGWSVELRQSGGRVGVDDIALPRPSSQLADDPDRPILVLLSALCDHGSLPHLTGSLGAVALEQMLATGRLYIEDEAERPLALGAPLKTALAWYRGADGRYRIGSERSPSADLLPVTPPWYLDAANRTCGPLATGLPHAVAATLVSAPTLTMAEARLVRDRLAAVPAALPLPSAIVDLGMVTPVPRLTLTTHRPPSAEPQDLAWLELDYAGMLAAPDPAQPAPLCHSGPDGRVRMYRDREAELRIWSKLAGLHLEALVREPTRIGFRTRDGASWRALVERDLPALRREGWCVAVAPDCRWHAVAVGDRNGENWRTVPLDGPQRVLYETVRTTMRQRIRAALEDADAVRAQRLLRDASQKLHQICWNPRLLRLAAARGVERSVKLDLLTALLPAMLAEGRRVLILADPPALRRLIAAHLAENGIATIEHSTQPLAPSSRATVYLEGTKTNPGRHARLGVDTLIRYSTWPRPTENGHDTKSTRADPEMPARVYELITENTIEERFPAWHARQPLIAGRLLASDATTQELSLSDLEQALEALLQPPT